MKYYISQTLMTVFYLDSGELKGTPIKMDGTFDTKETFDVEIYNNSLRVQPAILGVTLGDIWDIAIKELSL